MPESPRVSVWKYIGLFAVLFAGLSFAAGIVMALLHVSSSKMVGDAIFFAIICFIAQKFVRDNGSLWSAREKWALIFGILMTEIVLLMLGMVLIYSELSSSLLFSTGLTIVKHFGTLWLFYGLLAKRVFGKLVPSQI